MNLITLFCVLCYYFFLKSKTKICFFFLILLETKFAKLKWLMQNILGSLIYFAFQHPIKRNRLKQQTIHVISHLQCLKGSLSSLTQFLATESPLKIMKNAFYFALNCISFSRYLNFCLEFLLILKNGLIREIIG